MTVKYQQLRNIRLRCFFTVLMAFAVTMCGCGWPANPPWADPANPPSIPRPSDADLIEWLNGARITLEKGLFSDSWWQIAKGEVSDFKVIRITDNPADHIFTATVTFRASAIGRGIQVSEAAIRYKNAKEASKLEFVDFVPVSVSRIGN